MVKLSKKLSKRCMNFDSENQHTVRFQNYKSDRSRSSDSVAHLDIFFFTLNQSNGAEEYRQIGLVKETRKQLSHAYCID